jgi:hypothetical protein
MRIRPQASKEQRRELRAALVRLQWPEVALEVVRRCLPPGFEPASVTCNLQSAHPDRFVVHVRVLSAAGEERSYAVKVYCDDFGGDMWGLARALAGRRPSSSDRLCEPLRYLPEERALVFPWVDGTRLSDIVDERKLALLRRAAVLAADFHRARPTPAPLLTPETVVADAVERSRRLQDRCPALEPTLRELIGLLEGAVAELDPQPPTMIHGDMAAGQFLWTGERLVLLDMDTIARGDPAYDIGHFLGQLERRCVLDASLPPHAGEWLSCFRAAYPAEALGVSWRNVSFYQGVTLFRKMYTLAVRDPIEGPWLAARLAERARAALQGVGPSEATQMAGNTWGRERRNA